MQGTSLIHFEQIPYIFPTKMDWVFFSSKKGIQFFLQNKEQKHLLAEAVGNGLKLAAIAPATAKYLKEVVGLLADFVGSAHSVDDTAQAFLLIAQNQTIVFPQGQYSKQSIQKAIKGQTQIENLIVYQNTPHYQEIPKTDVAVFTSPLNVEAFVQKNDLHTIERVVAIGPTTAEALIEVGQTAAVMPFAFDELHLSMVCY